MSREIAVTELKKQQATVLLRMRSLCEIGMKNHHVKDDKEFINMLDTWLTIMVEIKELYKKTETIFKENGY